MDGATGDKDELCSGVCHPPGDEGKKTVNPWLLPASGFYCLMGAGLPGVLMDVQTSAGSNPPLED